ncbi:MAG TPA: glycosyltransferase [Acidimicrobiales bacterium]
MSRFLFVVPPLAGHVNPTLAVGRELAARGHDVAWAGPREVVADLLPAGARLLPAGEPLPAGVLAVTRGEIDHLRGTAAVKHLVGEFLVPLNESMLPGVRAAVDAFAPDAVVVDQQALAGVAVAEARGLPWATSASTSATLDDSLAALPRLKEWADGLQRDFLVGAGLDAAAVATMDIRFSPHLVLVFSTEAFVGRSGFPDHYAFVGPSIGERGADTAFDWGWLPGPDDPTPVVLVSLGTLNAHNGAPFFRKAAAALGALDVRGVIVAPPDLVDEPAPNVRVVPRVPQLDLLAHVDAVVCHGGHNTVCEALAHGIPLVVAPIRDDQPVIADQVVAAGAGIRVKFGRVTADGLREAVERALRDPDLRRGAARMRDSFAAAGGPAAAADRLERLPVLAHR